MLLAGILMMVVGAIAFVSLLVVGVVKAIGPIMEHAEIGVDGSETVDLEANTEYGLWFDEADKRTWPDTCSAISPSGDTIEADEYTFEITTTWTGDSYRMRFTFDTAEAGYYGVVCDSGYSVIVSKPIDLQGLVGPALIGVLGGGALFTAGLVLMIVALVKRSRAKRALRPPMVAYYPAAAYGGYPAPGGYPPAPSPYQPPAPGSPPPPGPPA
jgi:hypothetical protein